MTITSNLSRMSSVSASDAIRVRSSENGDMREASLSTLKDYFNPSSSSAGEYTQYYAPSATGFSVQVNNDSDDVWLILTPGAGYAAGTIVLPAVANTTHGQQVLVNSTQSVTTLTVSGNGATVTGAPTTLSANAFFRLKFDDVVNVWYRVG